MAYAMESWVFLSNFMGYIRKTERARMLPDEANETTTERQATEAVKNCIKTSCGIWAQPKMKIIGRTEPCQG
jgi:hypothetical protein